MFLAKKILKNKILLLEAITYKKKHGWSKKG